MRKYRAKALTSAVENVPCLQVAVGLALRITSTRSWIHQGRYLQIQARIRSYKGLDGGLG